ncbi:Uncharacterised protein [Neisseria meningitidis]|nr:Uncharacterised protein [Neisseria meningitidis]CWM88262.1 Uncharacterised protein [Neisseria meningitidis]CWM95983.1 Uncharacterised protein [Neisseria meningitidis]CWN05409.1 Uncharacterised protein [Neisseria meningitidis]CWN27746.1 Uncharacterised protein [Neisseria meningitidis]
MVKCLNKTTKIQSERIIFHFETDLIQIWLQTGLEQQVLVDVFGEMVVCIVGYFDDIKRIFLAHVIECVGILPRVGIKHGNAVAGGVNSCFSFIRKGN